MTDRQVTRCGDCVFAADLGGVVDNPWECLAAGHGYVVMEGDAPPDWCPLRQGPITIRLRSTADE